MYTSSGCCWVCVWPITDIQLEWALHHRSKKTAYALWCPSATFLKLWHSTPPALTHSHTGLLLNSRGIYITERKRARGSGKYYITLLPKCYPYLGTLQPKLQSLKGNEGKWRRTTTVNSQKPTVWFSIWSHVTDEYCILYAFSRASLSRCCDRVSSNCLWPMSPVCIKHVCQSSCSCKWHFSSVTSLLMCFRFVLRDSEGLFRQLICNIAGYIYLLKWLFVTQKYVSTTWHRFIQTWLDLYGKEPKCSSNVQEGAVSPLENWS